MKNHIPDAFQEIFVNGIRHPYLYLWDSWSYIEDNITHLYCLAVLRKKPNGDDMNPNERNDYPFHVRHFTSNDDGLSWKDEGCFLKLDDIAKLNYRTIWSGSVKPLRNGKKLVAYTGIENKDSNHNFLQNIALAISEDGHNINGVDDTSFSSPVKDWKEITEKGYYLDAIDNLGSNKGEKDGPIMSWRDPFIFYDKDDSLNLFWAAKVGPRSSAMARATLKSKGDLFSIEELHAPITVPDIEEFTQLEVPKVLYNELKDQYYLVISSCDRLYENQPEAEVSKNVRLYTSKDINGPWKSIGNKILGEQNLFGVTILRTDFENNRLLCIAPYTENAKTEDVLSFAPTFYIYLDSLRVEFLDHANSNF